METVSITITPGCYVSNLSGLSLLMHPEGTHAAAALTNTNTDSKPAAAAAAAVTGAQPWDAPGHQQQQHAYHQQNVLADGGTLPLLHLWGNAPAAGASGPGGGDGPEGSLHRRVRTWGGANLLRTFSTGGTMQAQGSGAAPPGPASGSAEAPPNAPALRFAISPTPATTGGAATPTCHAGVADRGVGAAATALVSSAAAAEPPPAPWEPAWSSRVDPFQAAGRQRVYLQDPADGSAVLITYRTLLVAGRLHMVLFRWAQQKKKERKKERKTERKKERKHGRLWDGWQGAQLAHARARARVCVWGARGG